MEIPAPRRPTPHMPPLAFIYDRNATFNHRLLDMRLDGCRTYAERQGWDIAGTWTDHGDDALDSDRRPEFDRLLHAMLEASRSRTVLCLIHNWDRYAHNGPSRTTFQQRVALAGGYTATTFDEADQGAVAVLVGEQHPR
ncbi:recombinase family protein [Streptomyces sp. NPDC003077]|uniref:recombinase family protein n=1 Tax=Streptomyces sp. NPDC003077 TaxID=3154443 RepID=UPI0033AF0F15